jgi:hypothetical protein
MLALVVVDVILRSSWATVLVLHDVKWRRIKSNQKSKSKVKSQSQSRNCCFYFFIGLLGIIDLSWFDLILIWFWFWFDFDSYSIQFNSIQFNSIQFNSYSFLLSGSSRVESSLDDWWRYSSWIESYCTSSLPVYVCLCRVFVSLRSFFLSCRSKISICCWFCFALFVLFFLQKLRGVCFLPTVQYSTSSVRHTDRQVRKFFSPQNLS